MKKFLFALLLILMTVCGCSGTNSKPARNDNVKILTTFAPIYVMAQNITDGTANVTLANLTAQNKGCLHDYQLTPEDRKKIAAADILITGGSAMEKLFDKAAAENSRLKIIAAAEAKEFILTDGEQNPHFWLDPARYKKAVSKIADNLAKADGKNAETYQKNAAAYLEKVSGLERLAQENLKNLKQREVVLFDGSFVYLADALKLKIAALVDSEEKEIAPKKMAEVSEILNGLPRKIVITGKMTPAAKAAEKNDAKILMLDAAVNGDTKDSYLKAMESNIKILAEDLQ